MLAVVQGVLLVEALHVRLSLAHDGCSKHGVCGARVGIRNDGRRNLRGDAQRQVGDAHWTLKTVGEVIASTVLQDIAAIIARFSTCGW
jgi:hypothetical protein